jgi:hypothetical protein
MPRWWTDDQGRYVVPDLPKAKYKVWVRGYGLVDSPKVDGEPGKLLNLRAAPAPGGEIAIPTSPMWLKFEPMWLKCHVCFLAMPDLRRNREGMG